jgi:hypothetical protein
VVAKTCIIYQLYWLIEFGLLWVLNFVHNFANVEWDIFTKRKCRKNWMDPVYVMRCLSAKKIIIIVKDLVLWSRHDFFFVLIFIPFILHGLSPLIYSHSNLTITKNTGVGLNLYLSTPDATSASKDIWTRRTEILDGRALHPRCCSMEYQLKNTIPSFPTVKRSSFLASQVDHKVA